MADPHTRPIRGRISVHPRGFGFLNLEPPHEEGGPTSAFVAPPDLNPFLADDLVAAQLKEEEDGRWSASHLELVDRSRDRVLGEVVVRGGRRFLRLDPQVGNSEWPLTGGDRLEAGTAVHATIEGRKARFVRIVAPAELPLERVLARWLVPGEYSPDLVEAASRARPSRRSRRDLRDLPTVTIDAPSTMDLDDALAVLPPQPDGSMRVLVAVADVDALVPPNSPLDLEARSRGTSVYLPDRVIPMFPAELSEQGGSLVPGAERAALTVELRIDPDGEVRSVDLSESLIRSDARLSYEQTAAFLDEGDTRAVPTELQPLVRWLRTAAGRLSAARAGRGGLSMIRTETRLTIDPETGEPVAVEPRPENVAHRLVERLMVAANEAVARWLAERGLPALYRVHDPPEADRVVQLAAFGARFGFETAFGDVLTPKALAAFEAQFQSASAAPTLRAEVWRALGPARYTVHPAAHFGLGAPLYLHFTSPIRRYADLVNHRIVKAHLAGERNQQARDPDLETLAAEINERAYRATNAENDRLHMLTARLFQKRIGEVFDGHVVGVKPFGLVVELGDTGVTGVIPLERLPGRGHRIDPTTQALVGPNGARFTVGQPLPVRVEATDEEAGQIELGLAKGRRSG